MYRRRSISAGRVRRAVRGLLVILVPLLATACGSHVYHRVQPGETLDSIAFLYDQESGEIAAWNELGPPYRLTPGQRLRVAPPSHVTERIRKRQGEPDIPAGGAPAAAPPAEEQVIVTAIPDETPPPRPLPQAAPPRPAPAAPVAPRPATSGQWLRPTDGAVVKRYAPDAIGNKGVGIGGRFGQPVRAISGGKVVYSGDGLINYGKLIIIKHDERYLSAYGYNDRLRVKEGDNVVAGQHIADMGRSPDGVVMLHFEMRYNGKPVDPARYIAGL